MVRQIVFTKLEQKMLSECGLRLPELERIMASLIETLRSSFDVRVRYPWQKDEDARQPRPDATVPAQDSAPRPRPTPPQPAEAAIQSVAPTAAEAAAAIPLLATKKSERSDPSRVEPAPSSPPRGDPSRGDPSRADPSRVRVMTMRLGARPDPSKPGAGQGVTRVAAVLSRRAQVR